jgi:hypothetical protein
MSAIEHMKAAIERFKAEGVPNDAIAENDEPNSPEDNHPLSISIEPSPSSPTDRAVRLTVAPPNVYQRTDSPTRSVYPQR